MPLEHLLAALEREAQARAERLRTDARAEADRITQASETEIAQRRASALGTREAELRGAAEAALSAARRTGRAAVLEARERLWARVLAAARERFPAAMRSDAYRTVLPAELADALAAVGEGAPVIHCPATLAPLIQGALPPGTSPAIESDPQARPGFTVATRDAQVEVDSTFEERLGRLEAEIAVQVFARLRSSA